MSTKIPVTIHGNLTADVESGTGRNGPWARFSVAVTDRRFDPETNTWEDGQTVFHRVAVFGKQATNAATSLSKGSPVLVSGELQFGTYEDKNTQELRESRQIIADHVAVSLQFNPVQELRAPKGPGPEVQQSTTGPVATPAATGATALAR